MRVYSNKCVQCFFGSLVLIVCIGAGVGPVHDEKQSDPVDVVRKISEERFRCILVGDSQTTDPSANRIRTQNHRWDSPIVGELVVVGNSSAGFLVNNGTGNIPGLSYRIVDLNDGWPDGGPNDFFASFAGCWTTDGDVSSPNSRIGRYRLRFGTGNTDAPWDNHWGVDQPLVAKIAVRTGPMCVDAVETRAERGGATSVSARTVHSLNKTWGVQVIEQEIPTDFNSMGDDVGVGLYLPASSSEKAGQELQVLGVLIERVDQHGNPMQGTVIGYQGRGGWAIEDHLYKLSKASRVALIEMVNPEYVMIMLGHNQESEGQQAVLSNLLLLVKQWEAAFAASGRSRPSIIYVTPWTIITKSASPYMLTVESVMNDLASMHRRDVHVNYLSRYNYIRPDIFDHTRYTLDGPNVHPGDIPTAVNMSEDLYQMLFYPRQELK